jgi:hypothetical protein
MGANVGDRIVVRSRRVGQPDHVGEVVEVIETTTGRERYRVRWSGGRVSLIWPGSDAAIWPGSDAALEGRPAAPIDADDHSGAYSVTATVTVRFDEDDEHCECLATFETTGGIVTGLGRARRHPQDPVVPMIGEELAVARALADLAAQLEQAARDAIVAGDRKDNHLVS